MIPQVQGANTAACDYCGRQNPEGAPACSGCGKTLLVTMPPAEPGPKRKSKGVAVCLALVFGPLGLLYSSVYGGCVMLVLAFPLYLLTHGGLWFSLGGRIVCAAWAYAAFSNAAEAGTPDQRARRLLETAARLESVDRRKAIAVYQQLAKLFPQSPAGREAVRNIDTLKRHL